MRKGFTLVEIMIVVAIIGLLAAIAIPSFMKARTTSQKNACINNLRQIESAKDQWAIEIGATNLQILPGTAITNLVGLEAGYIKATPICPAAGSNSYTVNAVGSNPICTAVTDHRLQ